ncbi:hypothetical protein HA402_010506 [Bradysia odoriphaga]|nr:hypothetical protein HA402_010506 [Bradysia odoriphaga]
MNFTIPAEVNNDILYCQKALRHYIHVHQTLAASLHAKNLLDDPRLTELENEIQDIGREQKKTVDTLRLYMENFFVHLEKNNLSIDRTVANANVANQLHMNFQGCFEKVEPVNVKRRLSDSELIERYIYGNHTICGSSAVRSIKLNDSSKPEKLEVLISPNDVVYRNTTTPPPLKPQMSLLKPKSERLVPSSPKNSTEDQCPSTSSANLNSRRLNLLQVLNKTKAKNLNLESDDKVDKKAENVVPDTLPKLSESPTDDVVLVEPAPSETVIISHSPTSSSATSLSGDTFGGPDLPEEEEEPTVLGKEPFLRLFGLYTHTYYDYLKMRRSERKRRNCTSTEKRDFHYGKIDILFERQSNKNKRVFLRSTPARRPAITKPKRKRLEISAPLKKQKTEPTSNSSSSSSLCDEIKMCISCMSISDEKCVECEACNVYYHVSCHESGECSATHSQRIKNRFCPDCLRRQQKAREKSVAQQRDQSVKKILTQQQKLKSHREQLVDELVCLHDRLDDVHKEYQNFKTEHNDLRNVINSYLAPINALTGRSLQLKDLQL